LAGALVILPDGALYSYLTTPFDSLERAGVADISLHAPVSFTAHEFSGVGTVVNIKPEHTIRNFGVVRGQLQKDDSLAATFPDGTSFRGSYRGSYGEPTSAEAYSGVYAGRILDDHSDASYAGMLTISRHGVLTHLRGFCTITGQLRMLNPSRGAMHLELAHSSTQTCGVDTESRLGVVTLDTSVIPPRLYVIATRPGSGVGEGFRFVGLRQGGTVP
jgi:hypothetical protein